jgi:pimeloyl-ACP methyl ester carboxylesterase
VRTIVRSLLVLAVLGGPGRPAIAAAGPELADLVRLAEAFRLADAVQGKVWPGWEAAPFPVLLVTADREFLVRATRAPDGFESTGYSGVLQTEVWHRARSFDPGLLATFPAFGLPPKIVIGRAEATGKASTDWVLTVLHEHFHQYQMSDPNYFDQVEALDLSGGNQTGMWMLNYPFPYQSAEIAASFATLSQDLAGLLASPTSAQRRGFWRRYARFLGRLSDRDRRYLSLQIWQEGVARYVELRAAEAAAAAYTPTIEFGALPDSQGFAAVAARMRDEILARLRSPDLSKGQRVSFYAFGAGLALLLDQEGDAWKGRYMSDKFFLEEYASGLGATPVKPEPDLVVLLHGLNRTPRSMRKLERALAADGYAVLNLRYPARKQGVDDLAEHLGRAVTETRADPRQRVHFVTHSLGGMVVRRYLQTKPDVHVGRVVMLSPPNGGSELVDLLRKIPVLRKHPGPSRGQLGTGPEDLPARLGPVDFEVGVITGERSLNPLFSWLIPGRDDGMVSVERAKVAGMADFLVVPRTHTFIMKSRDVIDQARAFLRNGTFDRRPGGTAPGV